MNYVLTNFAVSTLYQTLSKSLPITPDAKFLYKRSDKNFQLNYVIKVVRTMSWMDVQYAKWIYNSVNDVHADDLVLMAKEETVSREISYMK